MFKKLKDKKIEIFAAVAVINSAGKSENKYMPIHPGKLWAYTRQLSQDETNAANIATTKEERLFTVNWRDDLHTSHKIRYVGKWYHITRIDPFEDYKSDIQIYVTTKTGGNPAEKDLIPYDPALRP